MPGAIKEAELKNVLGRGARIRRVVVVALASGDFEPYLLLSGSPDHPGYHRMVERRHEGPRRWGDFRAMRRTLAMQRGYHGPYFVYPEGHPFLARLGIGPTVPEA